MKRISFPSATRLARLPLTWILVAGGCADAPPESAVGSIGDFTLTVDEVVDIVTAIESVPADVNAVASITLAWADYVVLAEVMADDPELAGVDFDPAVAPLVEQEMITSLRVRSYPVDTLVTEEEMLRAYRETDPPVRLSASHILRAFPLNAADEDRELVRQSAEELVARIRGGENFTRLARAFSDDPGTAQYGGSLGEFGQGEMLPEIEAALADLDPGQLGGPVETRLGWHVVRLDRRVALGFEQVENEIKNMILVKRRLAADSTMVEDAEAGAEVTVLEEAPALVRELARLPGQTLSSRAADRIVATHGDAKLTLGEVRLALAQESVALAEQVAEAEEEEVADYLTGLLRRKLLLELARSGELELTRERIDEMRNAARSELVRAGRDLRLHRLDAAPGEPRHQALSRVAREALERVLQGGTNGVELGRMTEEIRRGRALVLDERALGETVLAIASARMNRSASPLELSDTVGR